VKRLPAEALRQAEAAWAEAAALPPQWAAIQQEAGEMLDSLGKQEAARLQQEERLDEAIDLSRGSTSATTPAFFTATAVCRDSAKIDSKTGAPISREPLEFDPEYLRAKKAMGAAYYNEAELDREAGREDQAAAKVSGVSAERSATREDLGAAFHEKALRIVKEATPSSAKLDLARAIGLLRAAATTLNHPSRKRRWDAIVRTGDCSEEEKKGASGPCRTVLENSRLRRQASPAGGERMIFKDPLQTEETPLRNAGFAARRFARRNAGSLAAFCAIETNLPRLAVAQQALRKLKTPAERARWIWGCIKWTRSPRSISAPVPYYPVAELYSDLTGLDLSKEIAEMQTHELKRYDESGLIDLTPDFDR